MFCGLVFQPWFYDNILDFGIRWGYDFQTLQQCYQLKLKGMAKVNSCTVLSHQILLFLHILFYLIF